LKKRASKSILGKVREMTRDYAKGVIYAIRSRSSDLVYIGSTTSSLAKRLGKHVLAFRLGHGETSASKVIALGDYYIELLEAYPCGNKNELIRREGQIQRSMPCVNHNIAGRTTKEWRKEHPEWMKQQDRQWREKHRVELATASLAYYHEHKEERKGKITCECGRIVEKMSHTKHKKSKKHIAFVASKSTEQPTEETNVAVVEG